MNLGSEKSYRIPDASLHRPETGGTFVPSAALAIEIICPGDDTCDKLPFYAQRDVDELVIVDPQQRTVTWLGLAEGEYRPVEGSRLIDLGPGELAQRIDWP